MPGFDWLRSLQRGLNAVAIGANAIGTLVVLALVMVVNFDAAARGLFNAPFHGAVEVVQFSMVLIVFLQLPDVVRAGRLTRSDGLLILLEKRSPRVCGWLKRAIDVLCLALMTLIAVATWPEVFEALETGDYFGTPGVFTAPWWPVRLTISTSATLCAALFLIKAIVGNSGDGGDRDEQPTTPTSQA